MAHLHQEQPVKCPTPTAPIRFRATIDGRDYVVTCDGHTLAFRQLRTRTTYHVPLIHPLRRAAALHTTEDT